MSQTSSLQELQLAQLDETLEPWRGSRLPPAPAGGWAGAIRGALGMTLRALARRMGMTESGARKLELGEAQGTITLASLHKLAAALDCDVRYALVPRKPLREMLMARALEVAAEEIAPVSHTMRLEAQEVGARESRVQQEVWARYILAHRPRRELW